MEIGRKVRVSEAAIGSNGRFGNCRIPLVPDRPRAVFAKRFELRQPRYAYSKLMRPVIAATINSSSLVQQS
jgi:hypothetical protein